MIRTKATLLGLTALSALLLLAAPASARTCEDISLPNSVTVDGTKLVLNGMGVREATVFSVNVYVAGLYVEKKTRSASAILKAEGPRRLTMRFVRDVDRDDVIDAYRESFKKSGKAGKFKAEIKKLLSLMPAANDGATWTFTYTPTKGLEIKIGRRVKGTIEGAEFFKTFLAIWLGPNPPNSGLKSGLLGGECG